MKNADLLAAIMMFISIGISSAAGGALASTFSNALWQGSFNSYVGNNNFCNCGFGGTCKFICAGGGVNGQGGQCPTTACSSGQYTFDPVNGWKIIVSSPGMPQRDFAYSVLCPAGGTSNNAICFPSGKATFTYSFMFDNSILSWQGYVKVLFFGDGNNVLGIWPNQNMKMVIFPAGDLPTTSQASFTAKPNVWYDVTISITFPSSMVVSIVEDGTVLYHGNGYSSTTVSALPAPQVGSYTWVTATPTPMNMFVRNLCADANPANCAFVYNSTPYSSTLAPTTLVSTTTKATLITPTTSATTTKATTLAPGTMKATTLAPTTKATITLASSTSASSSSSTSVSSSSSAAMTTAAAAFVATSAAQFAPQNVVIGNGNNTFSSPTALIGYAVGGVFVVLIIGTIAMAFRSKKIREDVVVSRDTFNPMNSRV